VSTGDAITPHAVQYNFSEIFDDEKSYELWAYNIETVMAEKVEPILRRGVFNTRPRDFYDAYILTTTQKFDKAVFAEALRATAKHRGTAEQIVDVPGILYNIEESPELRAMQAVRIRAGYYLRADYECGEGFGWVVIFSDPDSKSWGVFHLRGANGRTTPLVYNAS